MSVGMRRRSVYEIDMLNGPILPKIIRFALPLMFANMLQLLYNAADLIIIGQFSDSDTSVAAVGATAALVSLIVNFFIGLSVGVSVLVARGYGSGNRNSVQKVVHTSITVALICGVIILAIGVFFSRTFLGWLKTSEAIIEQSTLYLTIYFLGAPANLVYNFGASILRATGDSKRPLYYLAIAGFANVVLNFVFVYFFRMDVAGVALATVISQLLSAVLVMLSLMNQETMCRFEIKKMGIDGEVLKEIIRLGIPAGIQNTLFSISAVMIQSSVNSLDVVYQTMGRAPYTSGASASSNIDGFVNVSMNAFYQAALNFTGQNIAAKKYARTRKVFRCSLFCVVICGAVLGGLAVLFGKQIISIYVPGDAEAITYGYQRLFIMCAPYFLCGIMDVCVGQLRGLGFSMVPTIVSVVGICGFRIFWITTVFAATNDWIVLFLSYPITWILTGGIHLLCYYFIQRRFPKEDMESEPSKLQSAVT